MPTDRETGRGYSIEDDNTVIYDGITFTFAEEEIQSNIEERKKWARKKALNRLTSYRLLKKLETS